jgi:CDP-glucose 4,6-dehydratase
VDQRDGSVEGVVDRAWQGRRVLVTGAAGLLGSWLTETLLERGATVVCLMRDWVPLSRLIAQGIARETIIVQGELENLPLLIRSLNEYEIDSVFHLGAQTIVGVAEASPASTFEANIRGTWNLLEACRTCPSRIQRILVASSDKAYGIHPQLPYTEEMPLQGRYPYDVSKSCADLIALSYFHTYRLPVAITRCGNLFGGGDLNFNRLIPGTIRSALWEQPPIVRSNGRLIREYFYVRDAVEAYLRLAEVLPDPSCVGQAFNMGTEQPIEVMELVGLVLRLMDRAHLVPEVLNRGETEIPAQYLDCTKARRLLGWTPRYALVDGLRETIEWYRANLHSRSPQPLA